MVPITSRRGSGARRRRRIGAAVALVVSLATTLIVIVEPPQAAAAVGLARTEVDRPDDSALHQVHVVYAVAADGADRGLDTDGTLLGRTRGFNRWLFARTPGRALRLDTYRGQLDITFFRSPSTAAELAADDYLPYTLATQLDDAGFDDGHKKYAVYYDGLGPNAEDESPPCGQAALGGSTGVLYLGSCPRQGAIQSELGMLHELFHSFGLVDDCAPHIFQVSHVGDDSNDLMFPTLGAYQLDAGHDDYYRHNIDGCLDLDDSLYLTQPAGPPLHREIVLQPVHLSTGVNTTATAAFGTEFRRVDEACIVLTLRGSIHPSATIRLTVDPDLNPITLAPPPPSPQNPDRPLAFCLNGPAYAAHRDVLGDGLQTVSLTVPFLRSLQGTSIQLVSVQFRGARCPVPDRQPEPTRPALRPHRQDVGPALLGPDRRRSDHARHATIRLRGPGLLHPRVREQPVRRGRGTGHRTGQRW